MQPSRACVVCLLSLLLNGCILAQPDTEQAAVGQPDSPQVQTTSEPREQSDAPADGNSLQNDPIGDAPTNISSEPSATADGHLQEASSKEPIAAATEPVLTLALTLEVPNPTPVYSRADVTKMLDDAERKVYLDPSKRNLAEGVEELRKVAKLAEIVLGTPKKRAVHNPKNLAKLALGLTAKTIESAWDAAMLMGNSSIAGNSSLAFGLGAALPVESQIAAFSAPPLLDSQGLAVASTALFMLAVLEATGVAVPHVPHNPAAAHFRMHLAASAGSQQAKIAIADRFFQGRHVAKDCDLGMGYAKPVAKAVLEEAEQGGKTQPPTAPVRLRDRWMHGRYISADDRENAPDVIDLEEDMAGRGNVDAQRRLAYRRLVGRGMEANPEAALRDFEAAAMEGDPYALFNVGYMNLRGLGVARNYTKANEYFEKSAKVGLSAGWNGLGVLHYNGQGVERNHTAARIAFEKGVAMNNTDCMLNLGMMYAYGVGVDLNETRGQELFEQARALGHWRAAYALAVLVEGAATMPRDCPKAAHLLMDFFTTRGGWEEELRAAVKALDAGDEWGALVRYLRLAEMGSEAGSANSGWMLMRNLGGVEGERRCDLAANLLRRSASYNSTSSMAELATMCLEPSYCPLSTPCSAQDALQHYSTAVELHSVEGALGLAWMHWRGLAGQRNVTAARQLLLKAVKWTKSDEHGHGAWAALLALDLERMLMPLLGPTPYLLLCSWASRLRRHTLLRLVPEETVLEVQRRLQGLATQPLGSMRNMLSMVSTLSTEQMEPESLTLVALLVLLAGVMWLRRRAQQQQQVASTAHLAVVPAAGPPPQQPPAGPAQQVTAS